MPADAWTRLPRETFDIHLALAECEYLVGDFARADARFDLLLERAGSNLERVGVFGLRMRLFQVAGKYVEAIAVGLAALERFGVTFPETEAEVGPAMQAELAQIPANLGTRSIGDLASAPEATDPEVRAILSLLSEVASSIFLGRPMLFPLIALRAVN